jgi:hypothetical protein
MIAVYLTGASVSTAQQNATVASIARAASAITTG